MVNKKSKKSNKKTIIIIVAVAILLVCIVTIWDYQSAVNEENDRQNSCGEAMASGWGNGISVGNCPEKFIVPFVHLFERNYF